MLLYSEVNILTFVIMTIIAISAARVNSPVTYSTSLFMTSVLCAAAANVFDFFWNIGMTYYQAMPEDAKWIVNFGYFTALGVSTYFWFLYTETVFRGFRMSVKVCALVSIPLFILGGLIIVSYFTGWTFYFDESGIYHKGPLFYLQHVLAYGYIVAASLLCFVRALGKDNYDRKGELLGRASFIFSPIICAVIQLAFQNIPILSVGIVISFLQVFIQTMSNMVSKDGLTQIANRKELYRYLSSEIRNLRPEENLFFMFMDIDHFKNVNDEYGHAEGDRALIVLARVLDSMSTETGGFCARCGGDEFAFAIKSESVEEALQIKKKLQKMAAKKSREEGLRRELTITVGCVRYDESMGGVQKLIAAADEAMYNERRIARA